MCESCAGRSNDRLWKCIQEREREGNREREREGKKYEALYQWLMKGKSCELRRSGREGRSWISMGSEKAPRRLTGAARKLDGELG